MDEENIFIYLRTDNFPNLQRKSLDSLIWKIHSYALVKATQIFGNGNLVNSV